jgi:hypothetical protein
MRFPHRVIPGFLSEQELSLARTQIVDQADPNSIVYDRGSSAGHSAIIYPFLSSHPRHSALFDVLQTRLRREFRQDLTLDVAHVLDARAPYGIHTDVMSAGFDPNGSRDAAWTFIIPLEDYDSHTIVFEQAHDHIKTVGDWVRATDPKPHDIDDEFHQRYLTHVDRLDLRWLTPAAVFAWRAGSLFAADRRCFHVSDDFPGHGLDKKRAIIVWSTVPKSQS